MTAGQAQGGGLHLDARPRHRLGRRRPRRQCRRAEGRVAASCSASAAPTTAWTSRRRRILVPANRFEILECRAALDAVHEAAQDTPDARLGALDVLCQHVLGMACADAVRRWTSSTRRCARPRPMPGLDLGGLSSASSTSSRPAAMRCAPTSASPRSCKGADGLWRVRDGRRRAAIPAECRHHRRGARCSRCGSARTRAAGPARSLPRGGRVLGEIEEYFAETLTPGDTFLFAGEVLRFEGIRENEVLATRATAGTDAEDPVLCRRQVPALDLPRRARPRDPRRPVRVGPAAAAGRRLAAAAAPPLGRCRARATCWSRPSRAAAATTWSPIPFEGRLAHQTLGMLLTRRLERAGLRPLGFVANDYGLAVWGLRDLDRPAPRASRASSTTLFAEDMLGDDLEAWLAESALMKRTFRNCAIIAGLIERRYPGQEKTRPAGHDLDRPRLRRAAQARAATTCSCGPRGRMRQRDSSTCGGSA